MARCHTYRIRSVLQQRDARPFFLCSDPAEDSGYPDLETTSSSVLGARKPNLATHARRGVFDDRQAGLDDQSGGAVGVDSAHISTSGTSAQGLSVSTGVFGKSGTAIAIYVPTEVSSR